MTCTVAFEPSGTAVEIEQGLTLLDAARAADIPLEAACGGRGTCGKCQVRVLGGRPADGPRPPLSVRESAALSGAAIEDGWRLACQYVVTSPVTVETFRVRARAKGEAVPLPEGFVLSPPVRRWAVVVPAATLEKPTDDAGSLGAALEKAGAGHIECIDLRAAREIPTALRAAAGSVSATVRGGELVGARPGGARQDPALGIAIDLGTTNLAAYLYRMDNGELLEVLGAANPLSSFGADIVTRLAHAARSPGNGETLQRVLAKTVNMLCRQAAREQGAGSGDIEEMVVVGNSGMHHLFLALPGGQLIRSPFVPAVRDGMSIKARDLGIEIGGGAYVFMPPLVGGFVGSDLLAVALSARMARPAGVRLALDIGTNTELLLSVDGVLHCCSTASGPALEGAALRYGTVAVPGSIDRMWTGSGEDALQFTTVENRPATGICGSGIVDALGCLLRLGDISRNGRLRADSPRVRPEADGDHRCVLAAAGQTALGEDLTISQGEVRALQLAKGAIRAGIETLLSLHGLHAGQLDEILIAGTFGNHLHVESAVEIGLLPRVPLERIRQIGNAAGLGAGLVLLSEEERAAAEELSRGITHVELSLQEGFRQRFARAQWFPEESS